MGKNISLYLDYDLIEYMDTVVKNLNKGYHLHWNRSKFITFMLRQALDSYNALTSNKATVDIFKIFEDMQRKAEEKAEKKKPKHRY